MSMEDVNVIMPSKAVDGVNMEDHAWETIGMIFLNNSKVNNIKKRLEPVGFESTVMKNFYLDYKDGGIVIKNKSTNRENKTIAP